MEKRRLQSLSQNKPCPLCAMRIMQELSISEDRFPLGGACTKHASVYNTWFDLVWSERKRGLSSWSRTGDISYIGEMKGRGLLSADPLAARLRGVGKEVEVGMEGLRRVGMALLAAAQSMRSAQNSQVCICR